MTASPGIVLEALTRLLEKLGGERQVTLRTDNVDVAQVGRQLGQQTLYIRSSLIPGQEPMGGRGMPQIMQPRLESTAIMAQHLGARAQSAKGDSTVHRSAPIGTSLVL